MKGAGQKRTRITKDERARRDVFKVREQSVRSYFSNLNKHVGDLRNKETDFYGIDRELKFFQDNIIFEYEKTKGLRHPRDLGNARENILKDFIKASGLFPPKYSISERSSRVAATSGHISNEMDIVFYDYLDRYVLMQRNSAYDVYSAECVYGVVQVKSKLTSKELVSAINNIKSYKKLKRVSNSAFFIGNGDSSINGFGVIFAYESGMDWHEIVDLLQAEVLKNKPSELPNAIFILNQGYFIFGTETEYLSLNSDRMVNAKDVIVHGFPDRDENSLSHFYEIIIRLLNNTLKISTDILKYRSLPLTAGDYSYRFSSGVLNELARCELHGEYHRLFKESALECILLYCVSKEKINLIKLLDLGLGRAGDNEDAYNRQPIDVVVYNPENLLPTEIMFMDPQPFEFEGKTFTAPPCAYYRIICSNMDIVIPFYYIVKENMLHSCPKCKK
ncbi:hypothetical protein SAMN05192562_102538 [Kosakonia arachidis]|uniref:DUF6602 domain-containing protein n=1 Tax=Kosakonia arachidis TaxID=551989 RepID=A0A1I7BF60_9ENTR|nr:DUF6602 domain-containing protein [Kosakonia arachidis]SFT85804.1 hypothetical protein SAMN05192562_102538 [Kosakonia arachidis]